ncbi:MAG TPA: cytochrome c oxidase assembly protein [Opitutaceae bacterium]|nr:cytochrome c oxidase assembly protein [Opitutaceae bacterium]
MPCLTKRLALLCAIFLMVAGSAVAHGLEEASSPTGSWLSLWSFEPGVVLPLFVAGALYAAGLSHMPKRLKRDAVYFYGGWLLLFVALVSPIHRLGAWLFSVHMTQHELLMVGAAPLLVLGRPGVIMLRALPGSWARGAVAGAEWSGLAAIWDAATRPAIAWIVHALALWMWHIPSWFEATLRYDAVHALQHVSFLGTALWFWHSVFRGPRRAADYGWGVLNLFFTAVHTSVLGALITFAPSALYNSYIETAPRWGLTGLQDQQLGGLVMWIPAGLVYILAALCLLAAWLRPSAGENLLMRSGETR